MEKIKIFTLHSEDKEWLNRLRFYKDEIKFLQERVDEITGKYSDKNVLAHCEHYSNQLEIQRSAAQKLKHAIERDEKRLEQNIKANPIASDHRSLEDHAVERDQITTFEHIYHKFKVELINFFAKYM